MTEWRLKAYRHWLTMTEPTWANVRYAPIDYQAISYYSAPKQKKDAPKSLDEVDPKLLETYEKLGVPLHERATLAGVAVDAVFDSVSVATTFKEQAAGGRRHLLLVLRGGPRAPGARAQVPRLGRADHRQLLRDAQLGRLLRRLVRLRAEGRALPDGAVAPTSASTPSKTGQFERTLIVADEGAYVSYLEGCTAPMRDENQLHAAVVELVALRGRADQVLDRAELVPGRQGRQRRHLQLRHEARQVRGARARASRGRRSRRARRSRGSTPPASCRATSRWASSTRSR